MFADMGNAAAPDATAAVANEPNGGALPVGGPFGCCHLSKAGLRYGAAGKRVGGTLAGNDAGGRRAPGIGPELVGLPA